MSTGTKILVFVGGGAILILLLIFVAYPLFRRPAATTTDTTTQPATTGATPSALQPLPSDQNQAATQINDTTIQPVTNDQTNSQASENAEIERTTRYFVERFGSYSNFTGFDNVVSLQGLMTQSMKNYADSLAAQTSRNQAGYYGVTTKLINETITEHELKKSATVTILVQQEIQDGLDATPTVTSKSGRVELVYQENQWFINGIFYNQ